MVRRYWSPSSIAGYICPLSMLTYFLVMLGMLLNVGAQIALKQTTKRMELNHGGLFNEPLQLIQDPFFILGLLLYAISVLNWIVVLSRLELSVAYPLMSIGYILTLFAGVYWYAEPISVTRVVGILTIITGVILITRPVSHV